MRAFAFTRLVLASTLLASATLSCGGTGGNEFGGCEEGECCLPLDEFCVTSQCPDRAESEAEARAVAPHLEFFCVAEVGTCGDLEYVGWGDGFGSETHFFNANNELLAVGIGSDTNQFCGGTAFSVFYGFVPDCRREVREDFCPDRP